jgi:hypothetical protein
MKIVVSPATTFLDIDAAGQDTIFLKDHMPNPADIRISIKNKQHYFKNTIIDIFKDAGIDYEDKLFISDHYLRFEDFKNFEIDLNNIFIRNANLFIQNKAVMREPEAVLYNFTFASNKCRPHRNLCSTVISNLFNIENICYSFIGHPNEFLVDELLIDTDYKFDKTKTLAEKFFFMKSTDLVNRDYGHVVDYAKNNAESYNFLYDKLYCNSATSIVTEPCFFERGNMLTEKTLMAIYARQFMIWPGAWKLAETTKQLGIDIFDDIIDHSYQYIEHPGKRVVEAFLRNKEFLNDRKMQEQLRDRHGQRFVNNLELVRDMPKLLANMKSLNINTR